MLPQQIQVNNDVLLTRLSLSHAAEMFNQIDKHRAYLSDFVHWPRFTHCPQDSEKFIQQCQAEYEQKASAVWAIEYQGQFVGTVSFNKPIDWQTRTVYLGYWLSPDAQGKGIITQAVNALIETTRTQFHTYVLKCAVHNVRSNKVAERCGFQFEQVLPQAEKIGDALFDQNVYYYRVTL